MYRNGRYMRVALQTRANRAHENCCTEGSEYVHPFFSPTILMLAVDNSGHGEWNLQSETFTIEMRSMRLCEPVPRFSVAVEGDACQRNRQQREMDTQPHQREIQQITFGEERYIYLASSICIYLNC